MSWHLSITVDRRSSGSLTEQVLRQIKQLIRDQVLRPGVRLPSTRQLATDLNVSRSVVVEAYQQLIAEGWLASSQRSGTWVSYRAEQCSRRGRYVANSSHDNLRQTHLDLRPTGADITAFPRKEWLGCLTIVLRRASRLDLDYPPTSGVPALREELAQYLGRVRGLRVLPDQVVVTVGFAQGLSLVGHMLRRLGIHSIALEDPGQPYLRNFIEKIGLRTVGVPVDENGIDVAALERSAARSVLVTPAHQFPTGVVLAPHRRAALLDWAERVDGLIIEDDYDGELWHEPSDWRPTLQSMSPCRVIYGGTASKTLAPGLRLGWLCVPPTLVRELERAREGHDLGTGSIEQLAYSEFIRTGRLDRHLRRMRARYRERRRTLVNVLSERLPDLQLCGSAVGAHAYLRLPPRLDERSLVTRVARQRLLIPGVTHFGLGHASPAPGLIVGYAFPPMTILVEALHILAAAADDLAGSVHLAPATSLRG
ncbi:GntR family transcriptional regulator [Longimycelium tulufanense]|uniref:GntR family transcriptional regulator n=1 Tax=Longimycelium tulufanense TaxID=907463 RepID=A0A8J3CL20_9PSEU|nr:PLP-dependent aminotransferase family protein [Longimycelium tulufanense]GGM80573.1 GntR family transcriptional regulator [Longimycelium tulufanense]